jgi:hypothetical protein
MKIHVKQFGFAVIAILLAGCSTAICGTNPRFWYTPHKDKLTTAHTRDLNDAIFQLTAQFDLQLVGNYGDLRIYCGIPGVKNSDCKHSDSRTLSLAFSSTDGSFTLTQSAPGEPTESTKTLRAAVGALMTRVLGDGGFDEAQGFECKSMLARNSTGRLSNRC